MTEEEKEKEGKWTIACASRDAPLKSRGKQIKDRKKSNLNLKE
jgi:hypothetical protein